MMMEGNEDVYGERERERCCIVGWIVVVVVIFWWNFEFILVGLGIIVFVKIVFFM